MPTSCSPPAARSRSTCSSPRTTSTRSTSWPGKRLYLPQQDSLRSYVAKGLLADSGVKLAQFSKVTYGNTSGGGLVALAFDMADVTVADEAQAKEWIAAHPGQARILKTTRPVPGGMSMVVRKDFCATDCARLSDWVNSGDGSIPGVGKFRIASADAGKQFTYVASLGITTPETLKGVTRVSAEEVAELAKQSVTIVDTRIAEGIRQRARPRRGAGARTSRRA